MEQTESVEGGDEMLYGAQYYRPPFPDRSCWERDLAHMREMGFNCIKLWAVWNWIEQEPEKFDFRELDDLVELAEKNDLKVIINTIPEGAPYWTYTEEKREELYQTAEGYSVEYSGPANIPSAGWPGLCMDSPEYAGLVARFIEMTAAHFANKKQVIAIDVWNEPHLEPMYDYRSQMLCYCKHSKKEFVKWLQKKYGTVEELNKAWYRRYTSWSQVMPPVRFGTWADMIDWRRFWLENLQRWMHIRTEAARKGAPDKIIQTHVAYSGILGNKTVGGLANELGDEFLLAKETDWFGLSSFPKWLMGEDHVFRHFMHNEMIAAAAHGKMFYQVELQGGAGKPGLLGGEVPSARDVALWNWNTIAAGGKGSIYWQYAPEPAGIESPGFGLTGFSGEDSERSRTASEMACKFNIDLLNKAKTVMPVNGIYVSRDTDLLTFASERREEMYAGSLSGIYRAAYDAGIPICFFHQDYLEELCDSSIETLFLPMTIVLSEQDKEKLEEFVKQGGTLVCEACPGLYHTDGLLDQEQTFLKKIFGIQHEEVQGLPGWGEIKIEEGTVEEFTGRFYRQCVSAETDVRVLASFSDGKPAFTERMYGKGTAVWLGTYSAYHYEHTRDENTGKILQMYMKKSGYKPLENIQIEQSEKDCISLSPVVRLLEAEDEYVLILVNHTNHNTRITIQNKDGEDKLFSVDASDGMIYSWEKK